MRKEQKIKIVVDDVELVADVDGIVSILLYLLLLFLFLLLFLLSVIIVIVVCVSTSWRSLYPTTSNTHHRCPHRQFLIQPHQKVQQTFIVQFGVVSVRSYL